MLRNFFRLNEVPDILRIGSRDDFLALLQQNARVENAIYLPDELQSSRPQNVIREKTFCNVSFKDTRFYKIVFRDCQFVDCLFMGCELERCEIHDCSFGGCNFSKVLIIDTYVDPRYFVAMFDDKQYANIGVWVFQQLRSNALNTHQPDHFEVADFEFLRWKRYELIREYKDQTKTFRDVWWRVTFDWLYQKLMGYGHSLMRFGVTSLVLFLLIVALNSWFWHYANAGMAMTDEVRNVNGLPRAIYYTILTLTTVGYGDITPITEGGMLLAGLEALLGLVWFGMLTSIIVKKVFR